MRDTVISDSNTIFIEYTRVIHCITEAVRCRLADPSSSAIDVNGLCAALERAKQRTLVISRGLTFCSPYARRQFDHLVGIFHQSGLIYCYRIPVTHGSSAVIDSNVREARNLLFEHLHSLNDVMLFAQDLVWPLFIAGTESCGCPADQAWIKKKMEEVMQASGYLDRQRVLTFLTAFWILGQEKEVRWIEVARDWARNGNSFLVL